MLNNMTLQGRLTADPELRTTQSGIKVCSFTVAWSKKYNEIESKLFLKCTAWRGMADVVAKHFSKGREIIVEGELTMSEWTDNEGNKRTTIEMPNASVHFCGKKSDNQQPAATIPDVTVNADNDDELPF